MIRSAIAKLSQNESLTLEEAQQVMQEIMAGEATPAQIASYLTALALKGETREEILGSVLAVRERAVRVPHHQEKIVDCCGTGGDRACTFNVSTIVAFVLAGAGLTVAKHGNRSVTSKCGSADLLQAAGIKIELSGEQVARCIDEIGIGFIFAPWFHPAMKNVAPIRRELGIRTIFNLLGPLVNPAGATHQLIGVFDQELTEVLAEVCAQLGIIKSWIVHSLSRVDELTTTEKNKVSYPNNGLGTTFYLEPEEFGFQRAEKNRLVGGDGQENLKIALEVLSGQKGIRRDTVVLNAGAALVVAEHTSDLRQGIKLAEEMIDSGKALQKLKQLVEFSQRC